MSFHCLHGLNWGPDRAYIGRDCDAMCRSSELGTLKGGQYGSWSCGHPNKRRARFGHRHATEMMGASPGHHDARMCLSDVICHTGAAGKVVAGVRSWPDSESQTSRGRFGQDQTDACQTRSAGRLSTLKDGTGTKGMNFVSRFGMFREVKPFGMELA
jgi:hypothetical protein